LIEAWNGGNLSGEKGEKIPSLFFRFDEESSISRQMRAALKRVSGLRRHEPAWSFALSTGSVVFGLLSEVRANTANRISRPHRKWVHLFSAFELDMMAAHLLAAGTDAEFRKSMNGIGAISHTANYGGPQWLGTEG